MKIRYLFAAVVVLSIISLFIGVKDISPLQLFSMTEQQQHI
ncbi:ABC transporter permease, partial [Clostridium perfringens]